MLILSDKQRAAVEKLANEPTRAGLVGSETGTGKTLVAVELAKALGAQTILLIAPLNTKGSVKTKKGWAHTFHHQGVTLPFTHITSANQQAYHDLAAGKPGIYFIGREFFYLSATSNKTKTRVAKWSWAKVVPDMVIFDESHAAQNRNAKCAEVLWTLKPKFKLAMSATAGGNKFTGLWAPTRWLWWDARKGPIDPEAKHASLYVDNSFWRWVKIWSSVNIETIEVRGEEREIRTVGQETNPGAFVNSLPCYIREEADRTPTDTTEIFVDLTPTQRRIYDDLEADALAWLGEHPLVADAPLVKRIRLRQVALGEPMMVDNGRTDDEGDPLLDVEFADDCQSSKIDALHKVLSGVPTVIYMDSKKFAKVCTKRIGGTAWTGDTSATERARIMEEFGKSITYLVCTIPAVAEGIDGWQHVCNTEVWLSKSTNNMLNLQAEGRLNRRGQVSDVINRFEIKARDTDDDEHFERLARQTINMRDTLREART